MVAMPHPQALGRVRIPRTGRSLLTRSLISLAIAAVATVGSARSAFAQGAVSGQVIAAGSGEAIPNAQITAAGGTIRATSDNQGRFRITGVIGTNVTLSVRRIGYRNAKVAARVGQTDLTITLVRESAEPRRRRRHGYGRRATEARDRQRRRRDQRRRRRRQRADPLACKD